MITARSKKPKQVWAKIFVLLGFSLFAVVFLLAVTSNYRNSLRIERNREEAVNLVPPFPGSHLCDVLYREVSDVVGFDDVFSLRFCLADAENRYQEIANFYEDALRPAERSAEPALIRPRTDGSFYAYYLSQKKGSVLVESNRSDSDGYTIAVSLGGRTGVLGYVLVAIYPIIKLGELLGLPI